MAVVPYVGVAPTDDTQALMRVLDVTNTLNTTAPSRTTITDQIHSLATGTYATQSYVNIQDATYATVSYYQTQDALNIPPSAAGLADASLGVASLDASTHIPASQLPVLGNGYILGPFGPTAVRDGTTGITPVRIVDWNLGNKGIRFRPLVFMSFFATATDLGRAVIEVKLLNSTTQPTVYASAGVVVARGVARSHYNDFSAVTVVPVPSADGFSGGAGIAATTNIWMTAWLYDMYDHSVTFNATNMASASAYLLRDLQ